MRRVNSTLRLNVEATRIALMNSAIFPDDYIAGDAIVCDDTMF